LSGNCSPNTFWGCHFLFMCICWGMLPWTNKQLKYSRPNQVKYINGVISRSKLLSIPKAEIPKREKSSTWHSNQVFDVLFWVSFEYLNSIFTCWHEHEPQSRPKFVPLSLILPIFLLIFNTGDGGVAYSFVSGVQLQSIKTAFLM